MTSRRKRKLEDKNSSSTEPRSKRPAFTPPEVPTITTEWLSATRTRNFLLHDPLIDWLQVYGGSKGFRPDSSFPDYDKRLDFGKYIMGQGIAYEKYIMDKLRSKLGSSLVEVPGYESLASRMRSTIRLMQAGIPVIAQGVVWKPTRYGSPDLLVRSDWINALVDTPGISGKVRGCGLSSAWHYRVVDIKFSTLKLRADATTLLNSGSQRAYKAQVCVYNECLGYLQGYTPSRAYLLGRGWDAVKKGVTYACNDPFSKLGIVDFTGNDSEVPEEVEAAMEWLGRLRVSGASWQVYPDPSVPELYPNMGNTNTSDWTKAKKEIAEKLEEVTLVWQCGKNSQEIAHGNGIFKWSDSRCNAKALGITGKVHPPLVDKLLMINRGKGPPVQPARIKSEIYDWRTPGKELFIDFENVSSIHSLEDNSCNMIYMMGIGAQEQGEWKYKALVAESLDLKQEEEIIRGFLRTIKELVDVPLSCEGCAEDLPFCYGHASCPGCGWTYCPEIGWWDGQAQCACTDFGVKAPEIRLWHYSPAECSMLNKALERISFSKEDRDLEDIRARLRLCDLFQLVKEEPVLVRGAMDFSLKSLVGALYKLGKISCSYGDCKLQNGTASLLAAIVANSDSTGKTLGEHPLIAEVIKYNEVDCKSLKEILDYLRSHH